jgi:hypothetical protein
VGGVGQVQDVGAGGPDGLGAAVVNVGRGVKAQPRMAVIMVRTSG